METEKNISNKNTPKILIVDDLNINVRILENIIQTEGYEAACALNVQDALDIMNQNMPDLILSDLSMPGMDGLEFCRLLKSNPATRDIPFIFITVANSGEEKKAAFSAGAVDYIPKPFEPIEVLMRVNNHLNSYRIKQEMENYNRLMHQMVGEQKKQIEKERENVLLALAKLVEKKSAHTSDHLELVGCNCQILAQSMQLIPRYEDQITDNFVDIIRTASKLYNIGKIVNTDAYSSRNMEDEQEEIRMHTEEGAQILEEIGKGSNSSRFLNMAVLIARYHHAKWDGSGYPEGLAGEDIPLPARITKVANDFTKLIDRKHLTKEEALKRMDEKTGMDYDPEIMKVFCKIRKQLRTE